MEKKIKSPTKTVIAEQLGNKIAAHLTRFEKDPVINAGRSYDNEKREWFADPNGSREYWCARARGERHRVWVIYINYQQGSYLSIEEAARYLAWLDAGNVGPHYVMPKPRRDA